MAMDRDDAPSILVCAFLVIKTMAIAIRQARDDELEVLIPILLLAEGSGVH